MKGRQQQGAGRLDILHEEQIEYYFGDMGLGWILGSKRRSTQDHRNGRAFQSVLDDRL